MDFADTIARVSNSIAITGLLTAGGCALIMAFVRVRRSEAMPPPLALVAGFGLITLALDAMLGWHQSAGAWLDDQGFEAPGAINNTDDLVMLAYVAVAGLVLVATLPILARSPRFLGALLCAAAVIAVAEAFDAFAPAGSWMQHAEGPLEAAGAIILAIAFALEARRNEPRPLVGMRLEQPRMRSHASIPR